MKIAFVIQRYGSEILGGSEYHCRLIAERLAERHDVEVLTTCARDYITWNNDYPEGTDRVRGVTVRRFANARARDIDAFNRYSDWIFNHAHTREDELQWLEQQGPWCPALVEYLERHQPAYDALIFFTYLYAPTVIGLAVAPEKSILVPTAHDEPAIHLGIYREMFALPAAIAYNTEVERQFLTGEFAIRAVAEETVGCGVDLPQQSHERGRPAPDDPAPAAEGDAPPPAEAARGRWPAQSRGAAFRGRHKIHSPFALYGGRIEKGKGCEELVEYFSTYHNGGGDLTLALMGVKLMPLPEEPYIRFAGLLSERERLQALEAASVVIVPSPFESLSLLALEAFAVGTPVLANARSEVLVDHCLRSNAGLFYADRDEFVECLTLLAMDDRLRAQMGRNGRAYVREHYRWDLIMGKYEKMMAAVRGR
ncbi:MAG: glycosyltransferase family 4 protein [Vicinamibacterales bacterium]|jgi:glycosyltransferase involved in cell wall biosynthesis|nr:glycosyltransferase family 4 protein [Vicinamibacterales bacterium]